ncbi:MAG: DUF2628 domain-containing protein [Spirochaetia bacterium]|nr:DUF2628 domain-containing protein [Spirochaetia bacterium]
MDESSDELLKKKKIFIGKKANYYIRRWEKPNSWNWAAFFLAFFWMLYRKMYLYASIFIGIIFVESILSEIFFTVILEMPEAPDYYSKAVQFTYASLSGIFGNQLYKIHTEKKISMIDNEDQLIEEGGTTLVAPILALAALLILIAINAFFLLNFSPETFLEDNSRILR